MNNLGIKRLETERLILRKYELGDEVGVFKNWACDLETNKYVSWNVHEDCVDTLEYVESCIEKVENGGYHWVVELKDNHELIGDISIINLDRKNSWCELGYCYGSKFWGNGYATEALKAVIDYLLNIIDIHLIEARHHSNNPASGRVMEKAGMKYEATLKDRRTDKITHKYVDLIIYSITKD